MIRYFAAYQSPVIGRLARSSYGYLVFGYPEIADIYEMDDKVHRPFPGVSGIRELPLEFGVST